MCVIGINWKLYDKLREKYGRRYEGSAGVINAHITLKLLAKSIG